MARAMNGCEKSGLGRKNTCSVHFLLGKTYLRWEQGKCGVWERHFCRDCRGRNAAPTIYINE